jgi:hypothetical protein
MNQHIFISMASYLDPMLFFTLRDAVAKAREPGLLRFAVVDQHVLDQRAAVRALPFAAQVRYLHVHPQDTLGVSWARHMAFSLYDGEGYLLQIDSHMCFEQDWDASLRAQHAELLLGADKPILSTYPYPFEMDGAEPRYNRPSGETVLVLRPKPHSALSDDNVVLEFHARHLYTRQAVPGCHMAAGFIFCAGRLVEEVPYDPYLYFHGEEQSLSLRAYTRGWDIFHPAWVPLYHLYKKAGVAYETHHWHGEVDARRAFGSGELLARSRRRLGRLLGADGLPGIYGLGRARSLADYSELSGIDYRHKRISEPCAALC